MSVLSFPRIFFKGYASWDPCTFNNNDFAKFPTYNGAQAALNWPFLAIQDPPITPDNFMQTFRPYAIKLQGDSIDSPNGPRVPCEWNMFGAHGVAFVQYPPYTTTVTGGATGYGQRVTTDPLIGRTLGIQGDGQYSAPKLVDTNPSSFWSSQIYYGFLQVGSGNFSVGGPRVERMHSRWVNLSRIYSADRRLTQPAASVACCFQACIRNTGIVWKNGEGGGQASPLLTALQEASTRAGAQGVMVRFSAYVNMYFRNGILNDIPQQARNYTELAALLAKAWDTWNQTGKTSDFFSQPCYSHVVGSMGVWNDGELASVPMGRYLSANNPVAPAGGTQTTMLGPVAAQVDYQNNILSLDLGSAIPEIAIAGTPASSLEKVDLGTLGVGVLNGSSSLPIGKLDYAQYGRQAYEASAGIVDLPLPASVTPEQVQQGLLAIQASGASGPVTALLEQQFCAQSDSRGIYLDQGSEQTFQITVLKQGMPAAGASVLLAQYDQNLNLVPSAPPTYISFTRGEQQVVNSDPSVSPVVSTVVSVVTADENGIATAGIAAQSPGFPVVAFFPFSGDTLPAPPPSLFPPGNMFYVTVRVLPFDDCLPQEFIDFWNSTHDSAKAWDFVYHRILYLYDMIFSFMLEFVNLGSQSAFDDNATTIRSLIEKSRADEGTSAMPVTRDLSEGKRIVLQLYLYLVAQKFNVPVLSIQETSAQ
jgi:hypothetical protein